MGHERTTATATLARFVGTGRLVRVLRCISRIFTTCAPILSSPILHKNSRPISPREMNVSGSPSGQLPSSSQSSRKSSGWGTRTPNVCPTFTTAFADAGSVTRTSGASPSATELRLAGGAPLDEGAALAVATPAENAATPVDGARTDDEALAGGIALRSAEASFSFGRQALA